MIRTQPFPQPVDLSAEALAKADESLPVAKFLDQLNRPTLRHLERACTERANELRALRDNTNTITLPGDLFFRQHPDHLHAAIADVQRLATRARARLHNSGLARRSLGEGGST